MGSACWDCGEKLGRCPECAGTGCQACGDTGSGSHRCGEVYDDYAGDFEPTNNAH